MKNDIAVVGAKGKNFRSVVDVMNNLSDRAKLTSYIDQAIKSKHEINDLQQSLKTLKDNAANELGVDPKMFNTLVSLSFNNNLEGKKLELEELDNAIDALLMTQVTAKF